MNWKERLFHEFKAVSLAALYFGCWIAAVILFKKLVLAEYQIEFFGLSKAIVGALILSKVVIVLEHVSLGAWARRQAAWVDVVLRTGLYVLGVLVVLLLEKGFEARHEHGGFVAALRTLFEQADVYHFWANAIAITGALLVYNLLAVLRRHLREGGVLRLLLLPVPQESQRKP